jgi:hypothetical protein
MKEHVYQSKLNEEGPNYIKALNNIMYKSTKQKLLNGLCDDVNLPTNQRSPKFRNGLLGKKIRCPEGSLLS